MQIINIIEVKNGLINKISSFVVTKEEEKDVKVKEAETHFVSCVRNNRSEYDGLWEGIDDDAILDSDNFNNNAGYEVSIVWSHSVE